jgi:hypothetical protein
MCWGDVFRLYGRLVLGFVGFAFWLHWMMDRGYVINEWKLVVVSIVISLNATNFGKIGSK